MLKLPDLDLRGDLDVETAAKHLFNENCHHLEVNFKRYIEHQDEAALMQIRIGLRRTRVAMKAFKAIIHPEIYKNLKREFRHFGRLLGDARDLDVFLRGMLNEKCPIAGLENAYEELRHRTRLMRDNEYTQNYQEIVGGRFESQLMSFVEWRKSDWSLHLGKTGINLLSAPVNDFAVEIINKGRSKLLSRGASIEELSTEDLHKVRKFVKISRYHLRFFSSLFTPEKISEGYGLLVQMQDSLGYVNDVREGLKLMSILGGEVRADRISNTLQLMSAIVARAGDEVESHLDAFATLWHRYEEFELTEADLL